MPDTNGPVDLSGLFSAGQTQPEPSTSGTSGPVDLSHVFSPTPAPESEPTTETKPIPTATPATGPVDLSSVFGGTSEKTAAPENPNESFLDKAKRLGGQAWDAVNAPLLSVVRPGATGFEKGAEEFVSNFSSPLSLALAVGTMGTGGLLESAGASALKEAGLTAAEIADTVKGVDVVSDAARAGKGIDESLTAAGIDPSKYHGAIDTLAKSGLTEADISGDAIQRGTSIIARKFGATPVNSQRIARGLQAATAIGFTYQAGETAVQLSSRAMSAFKDAGDPDLPDDVRQQALEEAKQYGLEALTGAVLGTIGLKHSLTTAGELFNPTAKLRITDENVKLKQLHGAREQAIDEANKTAIDFHKNLYSDLGYKSDKNLFSSKSEQSDQNQRLAEMGTAITHGNDPELIRQTHNAIAKAAGKDDQIIPSKGRTRTISAKLLGYTSPRDLTGTALTRNIQADPEANKYPVYEVPIDYVISRDVRNIGGKYVRDRQAAINDYAEKIKADGGSSLPPVYATEREGSHYIMDNGTRRLYAARQAGLKSIPVAIRPAYGMLPEEGDFSEHVSDETAHSNLPSELDRLVKTSNISDHYTPEETNKLLSYYKGAYEGASGGWSSKESKTIKTVQDAMDKGLEKAQAAGAIGEGVDNYLRRMWEKPEEGPANEASQQARLGKLNYNVPMAKKRVFQTELEGVLNGYKLKVRDPITLAAQWQADMGKTIANRNFIDTLSSNYLRGSDGLPAVSFQGTGHVTADTEGSNPATYVNPHGVRQVKIADNVVEDLRKTGQLDRLLDRGQVTERNVPITSDNIDSIIRGVDKYRQANKGAMPRGFLDSDLDILQKVRSGELPVSELESINANRTPEYAWSPRNHITLNHPSFREWKVKTTDASGNPVWVNSNIQVHPEYLDYMKNRLGIGESPLRNSAIGRGVLKGGSQVKGTLLGLSPFHLVQEGLRAVMTGVSPFGRMDYSYDDPRPVTLNNGTQTTAGEVLRRLTRNTLTLTPEYQGLQDSLEGVSSQSSLLDKLPVVGKAQSSFHDFLFRRYLPGLKARSALHLFDKYQASHPDWTPDAVARAAAEHTNNAFGGQNWKAMGRSMATQDWARVLTLAPDWLESELRFANQLFSKDGGIARKQVATMAVTMWGVSRALNMLNSGNMHLEAPFGVVAKDKDGRDVVYSVRTFPQDLLEMASNPVGFLKGRLSPVARTAAEAYTGRDVFDKKIPPSQVWVDAVKQAVPIPLQMLGQIADPNSQQTGTAGQIYKAAGGTAKPEKSAAQQLAANLAFSNSRQSDDPAENAKNQLVRKMEDDIRSGLRTREDLHQMETQGILARADRHKIIENVKQTVGMTPESARLWLQAEHLSGPAFLQVYDAASPSEKVLLHKLLVKKNQEYRQSSHTKMTPQQRANDPTLKKFTELFSQTAE